MKEKILKLLHGTKEDIRIGMLLTMEHLTREEVYEILPNGVVNTFGHMGDKGMIIKIGEREGLVYYVSVVWASKMACEADDYTILEYLGELKNR